MKVLILSTSVNGGAGSSAYRLHRGLLSLGAESRLLVQQKHIDDETVTVAPRTLRDRMIRELDRLAPLGACDRLPLQLYPKRDRILFSPQWTPDSLQRVIAQIDPDVVNLGWVCGGFMRIETMARLAKPMVWMLTDMWPFTGGCHFSDGCNHYLHACGCCPRLHSQKAADLSHWVWRRKAQAWKNVNMTVVAPSNWMARAAGASSLFKNRRIEVIPFGLDISVYKNIDQQAARRALNLPRDKKIVLFGAWQNDRRKGFHLLRQALSRLRQSGWSNKVALTTFGPRPAQEKTRRPFKSYSLGPLRDEVSLVLAYAAADVTIVPSIQEPFGYVAVESLACGVPVVAFNATGPSDIVDHRQNGYLAAPFDAEDLARGIGWVLADKQRHQRLGRNARAKAKREYSLDIFAARYRALFSDIIEQSNRRPTAGGRRRSGAQLVMTEKEFETDEARDEKTITH